MTGYRTSPDTIERIRELRYGDGLSRPEISRLTGVERKTVQKYAPGAYPGKVSNEPVRKVFLASGLSATSVARDIGWLSPNHKRNGAVRIEGDASRLLRTLGLRMEWGRTQRAFRQVIDAEVAMNIAEACGVAGWSVIPDEERAA